MSERFNLQYENISEKTTREKYKAKKSKKKKKGRLFLIQNRFLNFFFQTNNSPIFLNIIKNKIKNNFFNIISP